MIKIEKMRVPFKKDLSNVEIAGIKWRVAEWYAEHLGEEDTPNYDGVEDEFGLAYGNSDEYAYVDVTECHFIDHANNVESIDHFAVTTNGLLIMVTKDQDSGNYSYYEI